jgi:hypothetical protein
MYKAADPGAAAGGGAGDAGAGPSADAGGAKPKDDVVDAEFVDVDDKKK